jgi:hypothetical protein
MESMKIALLVFVKMQCPVLVCEHCLDKNYIISKNESFLVKICLRNKYIYKNDLLFSNLLEIFARYEIVYKS